VLYLAFLPITFPDEGGDIGTVTMPGSDLF